jgi:hypothetical protein
MKTKLFFLSLVLTLIGVGSVSAQGFQPPAKGKAVVYLVRVTSYGYAVAFEYFHNDKYIGAFKGKNYMRYELDPGKQLIWISSENKEFIECDLKEGDSYVVIVNILPGAWKARMESSPITASDERFAKAKELIMAVAPETTPQDKIEATNKKLEKFIAAQLNVYNTEIKGKKEVDKVTPEMALPEEAMK